MQENGNGCLKNAGHAAGAKYVATAVPWSQGFVNTVEENKFLSPQNNQGTQSYAVNPMLLVTCTWSNKLKILCL